MDHSDIKRSNIVAESVIQMLRKKGIELRIDNGVVRYRAPRGVVTADVIAKIHELAPLYDSDENEVCHLEPYVLRLARPNQVPLSFSQLVHWQRQGLAGHRPIRQIASATRIQGRLNEGALNDALSIIVKRHESLRTRIVVVGGEPFQETLHRSEPKMKMLDLGRLEQRDQGVEIQRNIIAAIRDVADYGRDPLFQAVLLRLRREENILILALDHMVSDGASLNILMDELFTVYKHGSCDDMALPQVRMQFADYALWQRETLPILLSRQAYRWKSWCLTKFPEDLRGTGVGGWGALKFAIDIHLKASLERWAKVHGTSLVMTVLTAYVALISRWCGVKIVSIQVMTNGRRSRLIENTIGYLAFPVYLRMQIDWSIEFTELLQIVTNEYCNAIERPDFYYSYIQSPQPKFIRNSCFNWLPKCGGRGDSCSANASSLIITEVGYDNPCLDSLKWDDEPYILLREESECVFGEVMYPRLRFSRPAMQRFAKKFREIMGALVSKPRASLQEIAMP